MRRPAAVKPKQFIGPLPRPVMKVAQKRIKKVKPDIGVPIGSIIARAQRMKTIPFRVQLAVASDSGSFSAQQMANIRSKEAYL